MTEGEDSATVIDRRYKLDRNASPSRPIYKVGRQGLPSLP
jgi:hypothetical protein